MMSGQEAYEEDVKRQPIYPWNGEPRRVWRDLSPAVRNTWEQNPTPRDYPNAEAAS